LLIFLGFTCIECSLVFKETGGGARHCQIPGCCHFLSAHKKDGKHRCPRTEPHTFSECPTNYKSKHLREIGQEKKDKKLAPFAKTSIFIIIDVF
jgi:hypothetical protein